MSPAGDRSVSRPLVEAVRAALRAEADPERAPRMQRYMKSAMPYLGVPAPRLEKATKAIFAAHPLEGFEAWRETVLALWREAEFREERYAALALAGHRLYRGHQRREALPMYEELVRTGAWWDYVDDIASHRLGAILRTEGGWMAERMREWSTDEQLWKRRASILCQLGYKAETDLELLYACIEPNLEDREFFIRKAIGWALRQYAWTDPAEVARYVEALGPRLSPLSRREALKNLERVRGGRAPGSGRDPVAPEIRSVR